jgi:plastocyanin domain-containing protein
MKNINTLRRRNTKKFRRWAQSLKCKSRVDISAIALIQAQSE